MTREQFIAEAIANGWEHTAKGVATDIFSFTPDVLTVVVAWDGDDMKAVKRMRNGELTDLDNITAPISAARWIRAPRQIRNATRIPKISRGR